MRFSFRQLEYFVAAGETGSVTRAAQGSHSSQPTVSAAIAKLEASLGVQLFVRHHAQGLSLTPEGRRFLGEAKALLRHASDVERFATALSDEVGGHARPGLPGDAGAAGRAQPGARVPVGQPARAGGAGRVAPGRPAGAPAHGALERRADVRPAAAGRRRLRADGAAAAPRAAGRRPPAGAAQEHRPVGARARAAHPARPAAQPRVLHAAVRRRGPGAERGDAIRAPRDDPHAGGKRLRLRDRERAARAPARPWTAARWWRCPCAATRARCASGWQRCGGSARLAP